MELCLIELFKTNRGITRPDRGAKIKNGRNHGRNKAHDEHKFS
jgi:hypothetical protein